MATSATSGKMVAQILLAALVVALAVGQVRIPEYSDGIDVSRMDEDDATDGPFMPLRSAGAADLGAIPGSRDHNRQLYARQFPITFPPIPTTSTNPTTTTNSATTTTKPTIINTPNNTTLDIINGNPCQTFRRSPTWIQFSSSSFPYLDNQQCDLILKTDEPQFAIARLDHFDVHSSDSVSLQTIFNTTKTFTAADLNLVFVLPSTRTSFHFKSDGADTATGFLFEILAQNSSPACHQRIYLPIGAGGVLTLPASPYEPYTFCEWWIETIPGKKIILKFNNFEVGTGSSPCTSSTDYLGVDVSGSPSYGANAKKYCGTTSPPDTTSLLNKMNVIVYGFAGNFPGVTATYAVV